MRRSVIRPSQKKYFSEGPQQRAFLYVCTFLQHPDAPVNSWEIISPPQSRIRIQRTDSPPHSFPVDQLQHFLLLIGLLFQPWWYRVV